MKTRFVFQNYRLLPRNISGEEYYFPYTFEKIYNADQINEKKKILNYGVKIGISNILASNWNLTDWNTGEYINDLVKLLFIYAIELIKEKYNQNILNEYEELILTAENQPGECPYDLNNVKNIEGFIIESEINSDSLATKILANKLAYDIIQTRDNINALFYENYNAKLLELDQERNLLEFFLNPNSKEELYYKIASLANLTGRINVKKLKNILGLDESRSIELLKHFLNSISNNDNDVINIFKNIIRLRQAYPIHTDKATGVIEAHHFFKLDYPIIDFQESWLIIMEQYLKGLKELFNSIKTINAT